MNEEHDALTKNRTWRLVPQRKGKNVIDFRWVYKLKGSQMARLIDTRLD
jgi:hypothetical protein